MTKLVMKVDQILQTDSLIEVQFRRGSIENYDDRLVITNWTERLPVLGEEYLVRISLYGDPVE